MLLSSIGLGAAIGISLVSMVMADGDVIFLAALGIVTFFLGLGFILNGVFLTVPRKTLPDRSSEADSQRQLDGLPADTNEPKSPLPASLFSSVTENTTQHLKEKQPEPRD